MRSLAVRQQPCFPNTQTLAALLALWFPHRLPESLDNRRPLLRWGLLNSLYQPLTIEPLVAMISSRLLSACGSGHICQSLSSCVLVWR